MSDLTPLIPRQPVPGLSVPLLDGSTWSLGDSDAENFTMVVFYRGLHCPICKNYLNELQTTLPKFEERGVKTVVISSDDQERALRARQDWGLDKLTIGHSLDLDTARSWGLYVSTGKGKTSIGIEEPGRFSEPGLFLVKPDGTLYFGAVQTMPFARPRFADLIPALDFVLKTDYPARGELESLAA